MQINRIKLLEGVKHCMPGIDSSAVLLEGADTLIFNDNKIYTYNDNISVTVDFETQEPLIGAVKAQEFYDLVSRFNEETFELKPEENHWYIESGKAKVTLSLMEAKVFDRIKGISPGNDFKELPVEFQEGIASCQFSNNKSVLSGIFVTDEFMVATDEIRINFFKFPSKLENFWFGDAAAKELVRLPGLKFYSLSNAWIHFKTENGTIFSCKRLINEKFPFSKLKTIVDAHAYEEGDFKAILPKGLLDAMGRATALAMDMDKLKAIQLHFSDEGIEVFAERSTGSYIETVPWDTPLEKGLTPVFIYIDHGTFEYGVKRSKSFYIKESQESYGVSKELVFISDNSIHIIGTITIPEQEEE